MKRAIGFLFVITACLFIAWAEKPLNPDSYFAYPRAAIVIESGKTKSEAECSKTYSVPTKQDMEPHFRSGTEFEGGISVDWEFVRQTEFGDVYLIAIDRPGKPQNVVPVLFKGKAQTIISTNDLSVMILPEYHKKKSG
ncbi:MAG TPA: hypothetical protein VG754_07025 [Verrucomicrobiae bacterium]|jgi:hypothetical protein|nr:hypothetical protein [Verrucomicrobiae bacterium]